MTKEELLEKANSLPLAPGVYLMHGKDGEVIYVGKAKKLKNRVSQYFQAGRGHNIKTHTMVGLVDDFDTIIVGSEFEALVLENALIKQYMPRYNILLKDDKGYPFVRLSREAYPKFSIVSRVSDDGARYFGPYGMRQETRSALDAVRAALHLPTCGKTNNQEKAKEVCASIANNGGIAEAVKFDVSNAGEIKSAVTYVKEKYKSVDAVVANAGIGAYGLLIDHSDSDIQKVIMTDLVGCITLCREAAKVMLQQKCGNIVTVSSIWGEVGGSCESVYSAAKGGIISFTCSHIIFHGA